MPDPGIPTCTDPRCPLRQELKGVHFIDHPRCSTGIWPGERVFCRVSACAAHGKVAHYVGEKDWGCTGPEYLPVEPGTEPVPDLLDDEGSVPYEVSADPVNRGVMTHDIHETSGLLQRAAQGVSEGEAGTTGRDEDGVRVRSMPGERSGLSGLPPYRRVDQDDDDFSSLRGDVGLGEDHGGDRQVRDSVRELPPEGTPIETRYDPVNHPRHYLQHPSGVECIQITRHMGFNVGNAVKYLWRADLKNDAIEDLKKARWYIDDEIKKREGAADA